MDKQLEIIYDHNSWLDKNHEKYKSFNCGKAELNDFLCSHLDIVLEKQNKTIMLAVLDSEVIGFIAYSIDKITPGSSFTGDESYPYLIIEGFAVDEEFKGNGYGQMLMLEVIHNAFSIGQLVCLHGIYLTAYKSAVDYYVEKFSFQILNKYAMNDPDPERVIPMKLGISAVRDIIFALKSKGTFNIKAKK